MLCDLVWVDCDLAEVEVTTDQLDELGPSLSKRHVALDQVTSVCPPADILWYMSRDGRGILVADMKRRTTMLRSRGLCLELEVI